MKTPISLWAVSAFAAMFSVSPVANAVDVVTIQCTIFNPSEVVYEVSGSTGVQLPASATKGASCSQAVADLLNAGYKLQNSFSVQQLVTDLTTTSTTSPGYAGPYYLFLK